MRELDSVPELVEPVMVAAFEGWNDAGEAASSVIEHLATVWDTDELLALEPDDYYDFQVSRPRVEMVDGENRGVTWPTTRVSVARPPGGRGDVVLVRGTEPNMRWRGFCADLLAVARELGVRRVILLGALLADSPHTRPVPVASVVSPPELRRTLGLEPTNYEGPTGIVGVLQDVFGAAGLETISLWAAVPHYVAQPPCPKGTLSLLRRVEDILDLTIPFGDLPEDARAWERGVDELASEDSDIASYVRSLEEAKDAAELPEASGEAIAREFERYLKRRGRG
ncbi:PAC2 family protein [Marinitenerispora sediminis]|uniref:Carboxylate--amine ligase n=1 Tax=Marinitenerispora sediminis TaxID=1931232 RepID=A0A368T9B7_9ACTN|nr:PAC2 family protein [Marinitenerispora sediminis]RCV52427.1 carboxylate--amine ligase [Marinitenerispora sediminis]RCV60625.1 carboxylate--amine ligase [Marinitenerispora sediminis]RCV61098.1 carboxylate--amine ligase [Marinitenerispora sediminis]